MFEIEKGIQIPKMGGTNPLIETAKQLKTGESFLIPRGTDSMQSRTSSLRTWANANGIGLTIRKVDGGFRVWRYR